MPILLCLLAFLAITIVFLCKSNSFFPFYKRKLKKRIIFPVPVIRVPVILKIFWSKIWRHLKFYYFCKLKGVFSLFPFNIYFFLTMRIILFLSFLLMLTGSVSGQTHKVTRKPKTSVVAPKPKAQTKTAPKKTKPVSKPSIPAQKERSHPESQYTSEPSTEVGSSSSSSSSGICSKCGGRGVVQCSNCNGTGSYKEGGGWDEDATEKTCGICMGKGNKTCSDCNGTGKI